jgi:hypothetical protein
MSTVGWTTIDYTSMHSILGSIATAEGSSIVKLGNTTIVCGVKAVSIWKNEVITMMFILEWSDIKKNFT